MIAISHKLDTRAKLPGTFTLHTVPGPMHKFLPSFLYLGMMHVRLCTRLSPLFHTASDWKLGGAWEQAGLSNAFQQHVLNN